MVSRRAERAGETGGRGGGGKGQFKSKLDKAAPLPQRVDMMEDVLVLALRLICLHDNEVGRILRENNDMLEMEHASTMPARMKECKSDWQKDVPAATADSPFPQHPEWPFRLAAFYRLGELVRQYIVATPDGDAEVQRKRLAAADTLLDKNLAKQNLLRFYAVTEAKADDTSAQAAVGHQSERRHDYAQRILYRA